MSQTESSHDAEDQDLRALLRQHRSAAPLPPGFQNAVWRRVQAAEARKAEPGWMESLTAWLLRPRLALTAAIVLVVAGASLGVAQGSRNADDFVKARYLNSVSPLQLRR